jgi:hypothetical protein
VRTIRTPFIPMQNGGTEILADLSLDDEDLMDGLLTTSEGLAYNRRGSAPNKGDEWDDLSD